MVPGTIASLHQGQSEGACHGSRYSSLVAGRSHPDHHPARAVHAVGVQREPPPTEGARPIQAGAVSSDGLTQIRQSQDLFFPAEPSRSSAPATTLATAARRGQPRSPSARRRGSAGGAQIVGDRADVVVGQILQAGRRRPRPEHHPLHQTVQEDRPAFAQNRAKCRNSGVADARASSLT